ncbi:hypothetical protein [Solimonas sp. K1W22B-7]|uniref:hypothetical protein n=1 Tax=Solimonas sp. K1W22B-7 TaxID=2303331 RepID=UPI0013C533BF|nr:hypothetical protein [Solimonas sp. K1W22B-7]
MSKNRVIREEHHEAEFLRLRDAADERSDRTGHIWDQELTSFSRRLQMMRALDAPGLATFQRSYKDAIQGAWVDEVKGHAVGRFKEFDSSNKTSRANLYRVVMDERACDLGFFRNKARPGNGLPVYTKRIGDGCQVSLVVDSVLFNKVIGSEFKIMETNEILRPGPDFDPCIEISTAENKGTAVKKIQISFSSVLPIREKPLGSFTYSSFYTLEELEALIFIHLKMYALIDQHLV